MKFKQSAVHKEAFSPRHFLSLSLTQEEAPENREHAGIYKQSLPPPPEFSLITETIF